jgi:hypothetical protein
MILSILNRSEMPVRLGPSGVLKSSGEKIARAALIAKTLCVSLVVLAPTFLYGCGAATSEVSSNYKVINTAIPASSANTCWYDDTRLVLLKGVENLGTPDYRVDGLYYITVSNPRVPVRIDLSPIDRSLQEKIQRISCQQNTVLFYVPGSTAELSRLYSLKIGKMPELISEMRGGAVNLQGQYVTGVFRKHLAASGSLLQGVGRYEAHDDCAVSYIKPGFKVLCRDNWMEKGWPLPKFLFTDYQWQETIRVQGPDGKEQWVRNPEPPLRLADRTEVAQGYFLRDLENRIVMQIKMEQGQYKMERLFLKPDPGDQYLYTTCSKHGDSEPAQPFYGRVCRFKLDGVNQRWEEVFNAQQRFNERATLQELDVNANGDVVVIRRAHRASPALLSFTATNGKVDTVMNAPVNRNIQEPKVSPDGRSVSFIQETVLFLAHAARGTP